MSTLLKKTEFGGEINELYFVQRRLTDEEIIELYNDGKGIEYPFENKQEVK